MNKKFLLSLSIFLLIICSFTMCCASELTTDMDDLGQKTENSINSMTNDMRNTTEDMKNGAENMMNDAKSSMDNMMEDTTENMQNSGNMMYEEPINSNYTATRTSTESTLLGMNSTAWTWLIVGVAAIAIFALIWYYVMQSRINNYDNRD